MKRKLNIIQIKGVRGLLLAGMVISCLIAGFVVFPGWVGMQCWNLISVHSNSLPAIGLIQGILLWGIIITSYFMFRKEKVIVCMNSSQGLSEEELKSVFADMKKQTVDDPILQAMLKAREAELKYKAQEKNVEENETADKTNV